jgi:teichuronic acid biosynthesis glycosyltransferase TuaH
MRSGLIKGRDFVILGLENWDNPVGSKNASNIAKEIAKHNRVLFVNLPLELSNLIRKPANPVIKKKVRILFGGDEDLHQKEDNLYCFYPKTMSKSVNWIKNPHLFDYFNKHNSKNLADKINEVVEYLDFKEVIVLNDNELFRCFYLKEYIDHLLYIFYLRDFITATDYWNHHGSRLEPQILEKSDLVVTNSYYYEDYAKKFNPNSFFVGQGCDLSLFKDENVKKRPEDFNRIGSPIIGYVGALTTSRLDLEILEYIAGERPEWNMVFIGTEDADFKKSSLHKMKNVHFLGQQDQDDIPTFINYFDVCLNPQALNLVTIGNYPLKIDEYLVMGRPVVATKTRAMDYFKDYVYLATSKEDYLILIERAINEETGDKVVLRRKFAASHTWEDNVKNIYKAIKKVEANKIISFGL